MPPATFESEIPASEWPHTHALDRAKAYTYVTNCCCDNENG